MGDEISDAMNLDLNLGPVPEPAAGSAPNDLVNLDDRVDDPIDRWSETVRLGARQRRLWSDLPLPFMMPQTQSIAMGLNHLLVNTGNGSTLQAGEGSVSAEERTEEVPKTCDNAGGTVYDTSVEQEDVEKGDITDGSYFDCNICLDLARDPVVTCCGHLFCWPCLYRWLEVHSEAKECPVCKGEVTTKKVTPIYGRGNHTREPEEDPSLKIPLRPQAKRVESLRQTIQRNPLVLPVEEMIRRLGVRIDLRDVVQPSDVDVLEAAERTSLLNRFLTSRGLRREQNVGTNPDEVVDRTQNSPSDTHRAHSVFLRRTHAQRANPASVSSASNSAERLVEAYFRSHHSGRTQEQAPTFDDRDSFSSIASVINSESQLDTVMEFDSPLVSLSTSSSRRRTDSSRVSDVDTGDSRAPRRRRLG